MLKMQRKLGYESILTDFLRSLISLTELDLSHMHIQDWTEKPFMANMSITKEALLLDGSIWKQRE